MLLLNCLFDCVDALRPSQQFFSHAGTISSITKQQMKCPPGNTTMTPVSRASNDSILSLKLYQLSLCAPLVELICFG